MEMGLFTASSCCRKSMGGGKKNGFQVECYVSLNHALSSLSLHFLLS